MSKIQDLLEGKNDQIDYEELIKKYPWIVEKNQKCILSPDSDGLLCGLFMSHYLNWEIVGFYDGKLMILKDGIKTEDCIFLDIEVFKKNIRSMGHHMLLFNKKRIPDNWDKFDNCIQPNNLRLHDGYSTFRLKYPLATIHMLIGIVSQRLKLTIPESAICALFFTDGTFNVLFSYPENVLNWLHYLRADEEINPLKFIFENEKYSVHTLMLAMDDFFRQRDDISVPKERGDRLKISNKDSSPFNIEQDTNNPSLKKINDDARNRVIEFIKILSKLTTWEFNKSNWNWDKFNLFRFSKSDFKADKKNLTNTNYDEFIKKDNLLSWAMTSGMNIEYTIESPDKMP